MNSMIQYAYNLAVLTSQLFSTLLGGDPDTSISQRTALAFLSHSEHYTWKTKWFKYQMKIIDCIIFWEKDHCLNSIKGEKNTKVLWDWEK